MTTMNSMQRRAILRTLLGACACRTVAADIHEHIRGLAANAPLEMQFEGSTAEECRAWQTRFLAKLEELLGDHRPPSDWEARLEESIEFDDHVRESLAVSADGFPELPIHLLTPKGSFATPRPGIVALHGHGPYGNDPVAGVETTPGHIRSIRSANYDFGRQLVRKGYVVAAPCLTPFGRRLDSSEAYGGTDACAVSFVRMQLLGKNLMSENLRDARWAFEFLARRRAVDAGRIGCVGLSYGGRMTMLAAAVEPRIRVAVISGALNVMQERIRGRYSCGAQVIPGLLQFGDVPEIAGLIAPRPAVWEVGKRDSLMVEEWIPGAWERIRRAYKALGAEESLAMDSFDGEHRWHGAKAEPALATALRP